MGLPQQSIEKRLNPLNAQPIEVIIIFEQWSAKVIRRPADLFVTEVWQRGCNCNALGIEQDNLLQYF